MTFVRDLVINFIRNYLSTKGKDPEWLYDRLPTVETESNVVFDSLLKLAKECQEFIDDKHNDRFASLFDRLLLKLETGPPGEYHAAFESITDELFSQGISWSHIVIFLLYTAELTNKLLERPILNDKQKDKTFMMVNKIISFVCREFKHRLLKWIEEQDGGWLSIKDQERPDINLKSDRGVRQYIGLVAFAAVLCGLYLCSK